MGFRTAQYYAAWNKQMPRHLKVLRLYYRWHCGDRQLPARQNLSIASQISIFCARMLSQAKVQDLTDQVAALQAKLSQVELERTNYRFA